MTRELAFYSMIPGMTGDRLSTPVFCRCPLPTRADSQRGTKRRISPRGRLNRMRRGGNTRARRLFWHPCQISCSGM